MNEDERWDLETIASRLGHDTTALNRKIGIWSEWASEDLAAGNDIQPLLQKISDHSDRLARALTNARRLAEIEVKPLEIEQFSLLELTEFSAKLSEAMRPGAYSITGDGLVEADRVLTGLALRLIFDEINPSNESSIEISSQQLRLICVGIDVVQPDFQIPLQIARRAMKKQGGRISMEQGSDEGLFLTVVF